MGCSRGRGGGGHKLRSMAVPWVPLVTFYLSVIATTVAPQSVSAALQEPLLTEEVVALQEIATALKRGADVLSNNWSWIKVQLGSFVLIILAGVTTLYLVDYGRKRWSHWKSLRPRPLEDMFTPLTQELSEQLDALGVQIAAAAERTAATTVCHANEVAGLRDQVATLKYELEPFIAYAKKGAEALDRMAMSTPYVEKQLAANVKEVEDLRSAVANLQAQLNATRVADAEIYWSAEFLNECLEDTEPHPRDGMPDPIEGETVTAAYVNAAARLIDSSALESISCDAK